MKRCYIITSYVEGAFPEIEDGEYIICADGGYEVAVSHGLSPDLVIGDSDSGKMPEMLLFPREKDESDTFLCLKHAVESGYSEIVIIGGIGGRLDHTMSNIQTLAHFSGRTRSITMIDEKNIVTVAENPGITIQRKTGFTISLFSLTDKCCGVTTKGLYYPLNDAEITNTYPVGLSNLFTAEEANIDIKNGKLLIVMSAE